MNTSSDVKCWYCYYSFSVPGIDKQCSYFGNRLCIHVVSTCIHFIEISVAKDLLK